MLDGVARMEVEGRGVVMLERGDSYHIPPGTYHDVRNVGTTVARALVVFVVDADKPLAVLVK